MKKVITMIIAIVATTLMLGAPVQASGASCDDSGWLGFYPWYHGIIDTSTCQIETPTGGAEGVAGFIWTIVANILVDLFTVVGYLAVGFIMYGGYLYITSEGDPGKAAKANKTIVSAAVGIIIAVLANAIVRTLMMILGAN